MKTIEERAKRASEGYDDDGYSAGIYMGYVEGAKEQKAIDINKACKWLKKELRKLAMDELKDNFLENEFKFVSKFIGITFFISFSVILYSIH